MENKTTVIPSVKKEKIKEGFLRIKAINYNKNAYDSRLVTALEKLPYDKNGVELTIQIAGDEGESYELCVEKECIEIFAHGPAGAFYAIQTLRQLFKSERVPCLYIQDEPDFQYRGFYHDVTRGKVPTVETIKKLIDEMAYYKLNSLQLYVEHTFEFEECKELIKKTGYLTRAELQEIDAYCRENFIDFIPSLSTFGHMYELLEQRPYRHLRVAKEFEQKYNFWNCRMKHHTIDPLHPESFEVIKSLIDQYEPNFTSQYFNICGDETFDLKNYPDKKIDEGRLYIDFVKKIIEYVKEKDKTVMMWADILLQHPETISELPEDICFLNWNYGKNPPEEQIQSLADMGRIQIVCPGTSTWSRFCEDVEREEQNISRMVEYGYKYGAVGVLNTNWGDWGNPCSIELAMYGLVLGATKAWSADTEINEAFYNDVNSILYENEKGIQMLKMVSDMQNKVKWNQFVKRYFERKTGEPMETDELAPETIREIQDTYLNVKDVLSGAEWKQDEYRQELLLAAEGVCVVTELYAKLQGTVVERITDTKEWLSKYSRKWREKNKESELGKIEELFLYCETV